MAGIFQFKQFSVDQTGCAMKINTDGVLLGAMAAHYDPKRIIDIGTGTGVIALMLAQRFDGAKIDAVEIDTSAAQTAAENFGNSKFKDRLELFPGSIEEFFGYRLEDKYDLIVSNPPFFLNSLESPKEKKNLAKHTDAGFFEVLVKDVVKHLSEYGLCWLVLPLATAVLVKELAAINGLNMQKVIKIHSFGTSEPHREIVCFGFGNVSMETTNFTIYGAENTYSDQYKTLLQPFFLNF